ncbi:MAG TPA: hypothetical protein VFD64_16235 [Gemmatimonadaceae bacterium]|nr:hypothetical protein [Gemmatimonadaceae bacterium]
MPLVSYAVARGTKRGHYQPSIPQLTVPLPKYTAPKGSFKAQCATHKVAWIRRLLATTALLAGSVAQAGAQRVTGPWEDGSLAPRGVLRIGITPRFEQWKERYDANGERQPLGALATSDNLGAAFPFVPALAGNLAILTGNVLPPLTFGSLHTRVDVTQARTDITLEYGVSTRLGLQALIPYVKNRVHVLPVLNDGGPGATLGFNPSLEFAGALQRNDLVVTTLTTATSTLSSELARCATSTDASCAAINANRTGATALVQQAGAVSAALASTYGTSTALGAPYAPVAGSALQSAVDARLTTLNSQFRAFLGAPTAGEWITGSPAGAAPLGAEGFAELLGGETGGVLARPLGDYEHSHVGDIELGAKFLLADTFGPVAISPLPRPGAVRLAVAGVYRLGTGQLDLPEDATDVGTGDRQVDLEARGYGDVAIGPRFWVSSVLRFGIQRPDRIVRRVPDSSTDLFVEAARAVEVDRDLGDIMELEVAPRYVPNDEFSIAGLYRYHSKGADSFDGTFNVTSADGTPLTLDASVLNTGSQNEHLLGFSITYSTVRAYTRGSAKWPLEVSYLHSNVSRGEGVPRLQMNGISFRFYRPTKGNVLRTPATPPR